MYIALKLFVDNHALLYEWKEIDKLLQKKEIDKQREEMFHAPKVI
jgi:hypothetical protein